jgi:hypothetical protein
MGAYDWLLAEHTCVGLCSVNRQLLHCYGLSGCEVLSGRVLVRSNGYYTAGDSPTVTTCIFVPQRFVRVVHIF